MHLKMLAITERRKGLPKMEPTVSKTESSNDIAWTLGYRLTWLFSNGSQQTFLFAWAIYDSTTAIWRVIANKVIALS